MKTLVIVLSLLLHSVTGVHLEKPGQCPPPTTGICVTLCNNDYQCKGTNKCCNNGCGITCEPPVFYDNTHTCHTVRCPRGQFCIPKQLCTNDKCFWYPVCISGYRWDTAGIYNIQHLLKTKGYV